MPINCTIADNGRSVDITRSPEEPRTAIRLIIRPVRSYSNAQMEGEARVENIEGVRVGNDTKGLKGALSGKTLYSYFVEEEHGVRGEEQSVFVGGKDPAVLRKRRMTLQRLLTRLDDGDNIYELVLPSIPLEGEIGLCYSNGICVNLPTGRMYMQDRKYVIAFSMDPPDGSDVRICFRGLLSAMVSNNDIRIAGAR